MPIRLSASSKPKSSRQSPPLGCKTYHSVSFISVEGVRRSQWVTYHQTWRPDVRYLSHNLRPVDKAPSLLTTSHTHSFSFSGYLSPQPQPAISTPTPFPASTTPPNQIGSYLAARERGNEPSLAKSDVHPTHLIALSLNEESRIWGYGRVFHVPIPSETSSMHRHVGYPTDPVYTPTVWSARMKKEWDAGSWSDRLRDGGVEKSCLNGIDSVIPICARILGLDDLDKGDHCDGNGSVLGNDENLTTQLERQILSSQQLHGPLEAIRAPGVEAFPEDEKKEANKHSQPDQSNADSGILRSSFKPPSKSTSITYIRRTEDISRYILIYPSIRSPPFFATIRSFEDDGHCLITRTHPYHTQSLRYTLNFHSDVILNPRGHGWGDKKVLEIEDVDLRARAAEEAYLASIRKAENGDVVRALWWIWHSLEGHGTVEGERGEGAMGKVGWQECKDIMGNDHGLHEDDLFGDSNGGASLSRSQF